uniref:Uncharacterized protein n=1 Tax=Pristionchus pacificus TaxID=54126 RepID=A0A2A6BY14_PRIPA|eukprot:PDM70759.1 hypothetical protein PRIPAC_44963 [Pristionchus pacificus]
MIAPSCRAVAFSKHVFPPGRVFLTACRTALEKASSNQMGTMEIASRAIVNGAAVFTVRGMMLNAEDSIVFLDSIAHEENEKHRLSEHRGYGSDGKSYVSRKEVAVSFLVEITANAPATRQDVRLFERKKVA